MTKTDLKQITDILPFDEKYILVGKGPKTSKKWNLMDANGKLISDTWFASITKNTDGSVKTEVRAKYARKAVATTFISTDSFAKASRVMDLVPIACLSLVDSGTIEPYTGSDKRYIAKAKLYGQTVFLDKDGNIYKDGVKLRLLFNTVDSERLHKAVEAFNRKLHYDYEPLEKDTTGTFKMVVDHNISMWSFYWVNDDWSIITDYPELRMHNETKKWTDDFIVRIATNLVPEKVRKSLINAFGGNYKEATTSDVLYWTWHLNKGDLDKIITTLAAA